MRYRTLGKTGIEISELGIGGGMFARYGKDEVDSAGGIIKKALDLGVNYIDTAPGYGESERVIGEVLQQEKRHLILSTKLGGFPKPFNPQDKIALKTSIKRSLELLGRDWIDILFIHEPDRPRQYDWFSDKDSYTGPVTELITDLKASGLIKFAGIAGTTVYEMMHLVETRMYDVLLTAFNSSMLWQESLKYLIPLAAEQGMGIIIGSPLQHGALAMQYRKEIEAGIRWLSAPRINQFNLLYDLVDKIEIPISVVGLRYLISDPHISSILMGVGSLKELDENSAAIDAGPLPKEIIDKIDEIAALVPFRPYEEPYKLPFNHYYIGPGHIGSL